MFQIFVKSVSRCPDFRIVFRESSCASFIAFKCNEIKCLFRSSSHFHLVVAGKTIHIKVVTFFTTKNCILFKCIVKMCLFRSSSHFHLVEGKTSHIPSQQESNHFLLLLMLNSGKWPQIFCYIQRNHPKKSKCRGSPSRSWKTLAGRC